MTGDGESGWRIHVDGFPTHEPPGHQQGLRDGSVSVCAHVMYPGKEMLTYCYFSNDGCMQILHLKEPVPER